MSDSALICAVSALEYHVRHVTNVFGITATLVVVLLSGFALPHHHPNHNSQQCVGWRQASRQRTARNTGLILGLELGLVLSAVEALHALLIAVACIQISVTDTTHEGITNLRMQFNAVRDGSLCCASPPARFSVCAAQLHAETRYVLLQAHQIELRSCRSVQLFQKALVCQKALV